MIYSAQALQILLGLAHAKVDQDHQFFRKGLLQTYRSMLQIPTVML